ncbi:cell death-inducing p53-target protein 1-like [Leguminivora glycinivorella]|uniref:cell death-inducing p53-target protein 1-like n=1 Tax=Leguminivora glycinivorella TaxID=1035111 RepID=UPI00200F4C55|nr:cell death-inducing p53-target protein 1-like [Leguminivora glycinivorella]
MASRPYQGYPYANPHVTDAPSIDAATASRWNNLPRRPLQPPQPRHINTDGQKPVSSKKNPDSEPDPVIYIDVPDDDASDVSSPSRIRAKSDSEPDPVIYIDVPDGEGSDVAGPARPDPEPEYVQETIFYDPFENRRIDRHKASGTPHSESGAGPSRPTPPNTLELRGPSTSSSYPSSPFTTPEFLSKESSIYGRDDFTLSPLPLGPYPDLPPAYSEIDTRTPATPQRTEDTPTTQEPPRTVVITPGSNNRPPESSMSIGLPSPDRKVVHCQHCMHRVHTLVIWEVGLLSHIIAFFLFFFVMPMVVFVYCTNLFKYKNHYCPNCNKKIGYEMPALCVKMTYKKPDTG